MWRLAPYFFGALMSAFVAGYWTGNEPSSVHAATFAHRWLGSSTQGKQDRLAVRHVALQKSDRVQTIEATGTDYATVVYRDRNGSVVFLNDPAARATVAMKGVVFPSVPAGDTAKQTAPTAPAAQKPQPPQHMMEGCEPALSPLASREAAALGGRCLASLGTATKFAAA